MKIITPNAQILIANTRETILKHIEVIGRTCYKSEDKITKESSSDFVRMLIRRGHESVLEHEKMTVRFTCDRGVSHELVRHRIASFSQESTRYCNYTKGKFGSEITVVDPGANFAKPGSQGIWLKAMQNAEKAYRDLIENGESPQIARSVLPNSLKTEIVVSANFREWREIFRQRTAKAAHPQMRQLMIPIFKVMKDYIPELFFDIEVKE